MSGIIVPPAGPRPCQVLLVGEAPGKEESRRLEPFVGKSGEEQERYLGRHGLSAKAWRRTNVIGLYQESNPDPSPELIAEWTPTLITETHATNPDLICAIGRFAMRFYLGDTVSLDTCHGIPHRAGAFDPTRAARAPKHTVIVPCVHVAAGFYNSDARALIASDYAAVAAILSDIRAGRRVEVRSDEYVGREQYEDVTGTELALRLSLANDYIGTLALDTEGSVERPWSIQCSIQPSMSWVLRYEQPDFATGIAALQTLADRGTQVVFHNAMFDLSMCRAMGLELRRAYLYDTQYASYLLRLEPQGLKPLAWRWAGMEMTSYAETVGAAGRERQIAYLADVVALDWPKPEPQVITENDGSQKVYRPQSISRRAATILRDIASDKVDKGGNPPDPYGRWRDIDEELRAPIESHDTLDVWMNVETLGPMRPAGIEDVQPLARAIEYSGRDSDATLRIQPRLDSALRSRGLTSLMDTGMRVLPVFEEMQATGMPASRARFVALRDDMTARMEETQREISQTYYGGKPFNPKSPKYVGSLLRRLGLEPAMYTDTGAPSTSKQSIEHLRVEHPAIELVMRWREYQHTRDMFCRPTLALMNGADDIHWVKCRLKTTRTTTRRLASADPNLLAMPKHSELGVRVRDCYVAPSGWVLLEADLSQIESRFLAHESRDPILCDVFNAGRDIHTETASRLFKIPHEQVTKNQRTFAKRINFGIPYGVSGHGMETQLRVMGIADWDRRDCDRFIREWMSVYQGCARYFEETERAVAETGEVRDCWGMPRYLPGVWSDDPSIAAEARRHAVNHKIQGGAQGLIQVSMVWLAPHIAELQSAGVGVKWLLQLHDALLLLVEEDYAESVGALVVEGLTEHGGLTLRVPTLADVRTAETWGGL